MQIASITTDEQGEYEYATEEDYLEQTLDIIIQKEGFERKNISYEIDKAEIKSDILIDEIEILSFLKKLIVIAKEKPIAILIITGIVTIALLALLVLNDDPEINDFWAYPDTISPEGSSTLSWNVSNASMVTIEPELGRVGRVGLNGTYVVKPATTTNYTLTAKKWISGKSVETVMVIVKPVPEINFFTASKNNIYEGGTSTLNWSVSGATDVTIDHGIERVESEGKQMISSLNETTTFTLTATNEVGSVSEKVEVIVLYPKFSNSGGGSWQYYKDITISNTGGDLTDYQVLVHFDEKIEDAQDNGADIRFSNVDRTELDYWIEDWYSTGNDAKIWVKVPSVPADRNTRIRMYYGNPKAFSSSDGDATFDFFDDFSTTTLKSDWIFFNPGGDDAFSLTDKRGWIRIKVRGDSDTWDDVNEAPFVYIKLDRGNYIIQTKEDGGDVDPRQHSLLAYMRTLRTGSQYKGYFGAYGSQTSVKFEADGYKGTNCETRKTVHYLRFRIFGSRLYYDWSNNGIIWNECSSYKLPTRPTRWGLGGKSWGGGGSFNADFDYFIVRKYAEPEPTVS